MSYRIDPRRLGDATSGASRKDFAGQEPGQGRCQDVDGHAGDDVVDAETDRGYRVEQAARGSAGYTDG